MSFWGFFGFLTVFSVNHVCPPKIFRFFILYLPTIEKLNFNKEIIYNLKVNNQIFYVKCLKKVIKFRNFVKINFTMFMTIPGIFWPLFRHFTSKTWFFTFRFYKISLLKFNFSIVTLHLDLVAIKGKSKKFLRIHMINRKNRD